MINRKIFCKSGSWSRDLNVCGSTLILTVNLLAQEALVITSGLGNDDPPVVTDRLESRGGE